MGKMRHIQPRYLWMQERVREGHIKVVAIPGIKDPAAMLTKCVSGVNQARQLERLGFVFESASKLQRRLK